jgi:hypothetical protein
MENSTPKNTNNPENTQNTSSEDSWKKAKEATKAQAGLLMLNQLPIPPEKKGELMFRQMLKAYQINGKKIGEDGSHDQRENRK